MGLFSRNLDKKAQKFLEQGKPDKALILFEKSGDFFRMGEVYTRLGDLERAVEMFERCQRFDKMAEVLVRAKESRRAAEVYERIGEFRSASVQYQNCRDFDKAVETALKGGDFRRAAAICFQLEKFAESADILAQGGDYAQAAQVLESIGKLADASEMYERAGKLVEAARAREKAGELERAAELYVRAGDPLEAARLYEGMKQFGQAGRILEENHRIYEAALMYEKDSQFVLKAAEAFRRTYREEPLWRMESKAAVTCIQQSATGRFIAAGYANADVLLLKKDQTLCWRLKAPDGGAIRCVALDANAQRIVVGTKNQQVYLLDDKRSLLWSKEFGGEVRGLAILPTGERIAVGLTDNKVCLLDDRGETLWTFETAYKVWDVCFTLDQERLAVASGDMNVYLLDLNGGLLWKRSVADWASRLFIDRRNEFLVAVVGQNRLLSLSLDTGDVVGSYEHAGVLHDAVTATHEGHVLIAGDDGVTLLDQEKTHLWRYAVGRRVTRLSVDADGAHVALGMESAGLELVRLCDCFELAAVNYEKGGSLATAADLYKRTGNMAKAVELFERTGSYAQAAEIMERLGDKARTARLFEQARNYARAASIFEELEMLTESAECYGKSDNPLKAAQLYERLGDLRKAGEFYSTGLKFTTAGMLFERCGEKESAIQAYEKAIEQGVNTSENDLNLANLYQQEGRVDDAIILLQRVADDEAFRTAALELLAHCFMTKSLPELAIDRYTELLGTEMKVTAQNKSGYYGLACAYEQAGDYDTARNIFRRLMAIDYKFKDVAERLERVSTLQTVFTSQPSSAQAVAASGIQAYQSLTMATKHRYVVLEKLGQGGMGVVFLARDTKLNRTVAWKVLPAHLSNNDDIRQRFVREARAIAALNHPNIVAIYDIGEERGESFISMEFVKGKTLRKMLESGPVDIAEAARISVQVAEGLAAAHATGVIHRDMKPDNVMVTDDGRVKIMDFGLARLEDSSLLTREGAVMGTWRYMSPEQVQGFKVDARTDVYAIGVTMYEMLCGQPPFVEGDLAYHHIHTPPTPVVERRPEIGADLSNFVMRCLAKTPEERFADGTELRNALRQVARTSGLSLYGQEHADI